MYTIRKHLLFDIQKLIAPGGYCNAGFPNYNTLFGRDSLIAAWQLLPVLPDTAQARMILNASLRAAEVHGGRPPELYAVVKNELGENILPIDYIAQLDLHNQLEGRHLHSLGANPFQAWSIGGLLRMILDAEGL